MLKMTLTVNLQAETSEYVKDKTPKIYPVSLINGSYIIQTPTQGTAVAITLRALADMIESESQENAAIEVMAS